MYTGGHKLALHSQNAFADALVRLLQKKDYDRITICELCEESGVSRQTFYGLFRTKENVLRYTIVHNSFTDGQLPDPKGMTLGDYLMLVMQQYVDAHFEFLKLMKQNELLHVVHECAVEWFINSLLLDSIPEHRRKYVAVFIASAFTGVISTYIEENKHPDQHELAELIRDLMLQGDYFRIVVR